MAITLFLLLFLLLFSSLFVDVLLGNTRYSKEVDIWGVGMLYTVTEIHSDQIRSNILKSTQIKYRGNNSHHVHNTSSHIIYTCCVYVLCVCVFSSSSFLGCIFAEMSTGRPLFCGSSDQDQLQRIFKVLGTPSRHEWPGLIDLPDGRAVEAMPRIIGKGLKTVLPRLSPNGIDLLSKMLQYDPTKRISAKEAMRHAYFSDLQGAVPSN